MKKKAASMVEVVVTVAVLGIITTISYSIWVGIINKSKRMVCEQNQIIIMQALRQYLYRYPIDIINALDLEQDLGDFVGDPNVFKCPCDSNGYAYNSALGAVSVDRWTILTTLETNNDPILCDSDQATYVGLVSIDRSRHGTVDGENVGIAVSFTNVRTVGNNGWNFPVRDKDL